MKYSNPYLSDSAGYGTVSPQKSCRAFKAEAEGYRPRTGIFYREIREFTLNELAGFDGAMGRPAYVAVKGIVYDVSSEPTWGGASHFGLMAGNDLTAQFQGCHGVEAILARLPKVGTLKG